MARATPSVSVWGAGTPLSTALAEGLRRHDLEATCVTGLRRRPGGAHRSVVFPLWDGRPLEAPAVRRTRLLEEAATLLGGLDEGRLERLIVISCAAAYGDAGGQHPVLESAALAAVEGDTPAADAAAVEELLGTAAGAAASPRHRPGLTVLRPASLLGPGCESALLSRHLAGPRLLVVRGSAPRWQVCHVDDLCAAVALLLASGSPLPAPAVVASAGVLDQAGLELASGRRRLELPARVAEATAARLRRTRLSPAAPDELPQLTRPVVVEPVLLAGLGYVPHYDAAGAVRAHLLSTAEPPGGAAGGAAGGRHQSEPASSLPSGQQAATLAGATVAVVGSAALLRRARRQRGRRPG